MTRCGNSETSAGIVYVKNSKVLSKLNRITIEHYRLGKKALADHIGTNCINEMRLYVHFRREHPELIHHLPTLPEHPGFKDFNSVFDPASYGQYLGGTHSEPGINWAGRHHYIGVEILEKRIMPIFKDGKPYLKYGEKQCPINNLHIHSKDLKRWM